MMLRRGSTRRKKSVFFLLMSCFEKLDLTPQRSKQEQNTSTEFCHMSGGRGWRHIVIISRWSPPGLMQTPKAVGRIVAGVCSVTLRSHLQLEDFDAVPVVPQLLLQLGDGLLQRRDLLLPLLVLVQPVGDLVRAAEHVGAPLLVQLWQRGHQPAHAVLHHLWDGGDFNEKGTSSASLSGNRNTSFHQ